ncbi:MAG: electron transfer flavoprotein subunit alpha/FixB family protein [Deltaproteobacteria bacterium]|nr:electron transfer flavoprotein subunit alpha/FixB family protein [Deltaproteobacteria bacterium]
MSANLSGYRGIWVLAEHREGLLSEVGLELLGKARELADRTGTEVTALLLGHHVRDLAPRLINGGADRVLIGDHPGLELYRLLAYTQVLTDMIREHKPEIVLIGATAMGVELAPRIAARLRTGLSAHCIDLEVNDQGVLLQMVPGWGGGMVATITCPDHRPQMATIMPGVMRQFNDPGRQGEVIEIEVSMPGKDLGPKVLDIVREEQAEDFPLEKAEVVVAGGWGIGTLEKWSLIEELARALGGAVGATRPPVDEGWAKEEQMIGQSGKTVRPRLYIGVGISGMMHHVVGMDQSDYVVAINQDPRAAIFEACDLGLVGDLNELLPALTAEIRAWKAKRS